MKEFNKVYGEVTIVSEYDTSELGDEAVIAIQKIVDGNWEWFGHKELGHPLVEVNKVLTDT
jgi:hypothetical protein